MLPIIVAAALQLSLSAPPAGISPPGSGPDPRDPIDVSGYPAEQREAYALLRQKCAGCHSLSLATESPLTAAQLKRHLKRPGFAVSDLQARLIAEFLKFHASRRSR